MKLLTTLKNCFLNFFYNEDRAIASLGGAPRQETISSEIGRHEQDNPVIDLVADTLNDLDPNHTKNAIEHADKLDEADNGWL